MNKANNIPNFTPDRIETLLPNEIFVFGSNLQGYHRGGAADVAYRKFGAIWGQGVGLQGQSYAIPTMEGGVESIKPYVSEFIEFAQSHPEYIFYVTRIGCGIAGFRDEDIAPLFAKVLSLDNVVLPKSFVQALNLPDGIEIPLYMRTKVYGQTATLVDMLIELNKEKHFTSAEEALNTLFEYIAHLRTDGDAVAFNCSIRSLWSCADDCFPNGQLDIARLQCNLDRIPYTGIEAVYKNYVIEKTIKLIEMMNEFRRYSNPHDLADDFMKITGGVNHCGPNPDNYYFAFGSPGNYISLFLCLYVRKFWAEFAPTGTLCNAKFRDFMIERHARGIKKYGIEAVIQRNYKVDSPCHPDVFFPYRGGAGPVYIQTNDSRKFIKPCGEGKGPNKIPDLFEFSLIKRLLSEDEKYILVEDNRYYKGYNSYWIPKRDYSLPVFHSYCGRMSFNSDKEKIKFIKLQSEKNSQN